MEVEESNPVVNEIGVQDSASAVDAKDQETKKIEAEPKEFNGNEVSLKVETDIVEEDLKQEATNGVCPEDKTLSVHSDDMGGDDVDMANVSNLSSMGSSYVEVDEENGIEDKDNMYDSFDWSGDAVTQDEDGCIVFKMSLQERLMELHDVFENFGQGGLTITNFWTLYFETYIEPTGWHALWKIKEETDGSTSGANSTSKFSRTEKVEVNQVNCATLAARVKRPDGNIAWAQMKDLYPLAEQENSFLSMKITAKCLDNYRFFLNHLYFPWDCENADQWMELHLESRVQFFYDLQSGNICESMSKEIYDLIQEAKINQKEIEVLEEQLTSNAAEETTENDEDLVEEPVMAKMLQLHTRQDEIKSRLNILEKPLWRNLISKQNTEKRKTMTKVPEQTIFVHSEGSSITELRHYLDQISIAAGTEEHVRIVATIEEALDASDSSTKIFLKPGTYRIPGLGNVENGGSLIGLQHPTSDVSTVIEPRDAGDVWLVANAEGTIMMKNLTIRVTKKFTPPNEENDTGNLSLIEDAAANVALLVTRGTLLLNNVTVEGFVPSDSFGVGGEETTGIKALEKAVLKLEESVVKCFLTGVASREEAQFQMKKSCVSDCRMGIEINAGVAVTLDDVKIERCHKFGIIIFSKSDTPTVVGGAELLKSELISKAGVTVNDLVISECLAGEICVCNEVVYEESNTIAEEDEITHET